MYNRFLKATTPLALTLMLCILGSVSARSDQPPPEGHVVFLDQNSVPSILHIPRYGKERVVNINLAQWTPSFTVMLPEFAGAEFHKMHVEQRQHRCFTISGEGPHLDFYDWKRQSSIWKPMKRHLWTKWTSATFEADDFGEVPQLRSGELQSKVSQKLKNYNEEEKYWLKLAEPCEKSPQACLSDCETEIRFFNMTHNEKELVLKIRLIIPTGC